MLSRAFKCRGLARIFFAKRPLSSHSDDKSMVEELGLSRRVGMDDIDEILHDIELKALNAHYPNLDIDTTSSRKPFEGHNLMVIQPWVSHANFGEFTDPDIQLEECVSLGNTIHNWHVVDKRIVFSNSLNRKHLLTPKVFDDLKDHIQNKEGISAVFFGVELLSGIQLSSMEKELKLPVYDRFTVVLNIFRQHAKTKEAKIQLALAELPYIRAHLREIHESSEYSSSAESLKLLVGGIGEKFYHQRLNILKKRERRLRYVLEDIRRQRQITQKLRKRSDIPVVSVVGYTNSGKTSLIKYLTHDSKLVPENKLFATLDVTVHAGQLPSSKLVLFVDTVGFISRIPLLLVEAFSTTLKEVQESDLIVHILDVTHPDHKLQYSTVIKALQALKIPKDLLQSKLTIGNKCDKLGDNQPADTIPKCDLHVSVTGNKNLTRLVELINNSLMTNMKHEVKILRLENGGTKYLWLRKHATITECDPDPEDENYLICRVIMSPIAVGRWRKQFGAESLLN